MSQISVIVPVYKVEAYLGQCIDSILAQTYTDFELILVDDGSPDNCGAICDEYAEEDLRIRVLHQKNQGAAAARNRGAAIAKSEWIFFVDSDDLIHPQTLELLYATVREKNTKLAVCSLSAAETLPDTFFSEVYPAREVCVVDDDYLEQLYFDGDSRYWIACCKLISKELFAQFPMPEGRIFEDNAVAFRWLIEAGEIGNVDAVLYFYRQRPQSTVNTVFNLKKLDCLWAQETQIAFYKNHDFPKMLNHICRLHFFCGLDAYENVKYTLKDNAEAWKLKLRLYRNWWQNRHHISIGKLQRLNNLGRISFICKVVRKVISVLHH